VRVVSEKLKDYVQSIDESKEVVIAPIPIRLKRKREFRDLRKRNALVQIGFFGRLHPDRGTKELVKVVEKLNVQRDDFRIVMAGEGPDKDFLIRSLSEILSKDRFTYLGYLDHDNLGIQLEYLDIYLSLAPAESYGLGIREAVLFGVPVVAIESNGSIHAQSEFGNQNISIIRADISPSELSSIVDRALLTVNRGDVEKVIEKENEIIVEKLVKSWLALSSIPLN
jgi:glycosyltransferase involved in cell wall biosynthesis